MSTIKFYLKTPTSDASLIYIDYQDGANRIRLSIGEKIALKDWDDAKERAKKSAIGAGELNHLLNVLYESALKCQRECKTQGKKVDRETLETYLRPEKEPAKQSPKFWEAFDRFIELAQSKYVRNTWKAYISLHLALKEFAPNITFDKIDSDWLDSFCNWLNKSRNQTNITVKKRIKSLKSFLNWAAENNYHANEKFRKFKYKATETDKSALTESELNSILHLDLSASDRLCEIRDLFVICCFTGLRFSDIHQLKNENFVNGNIQLITRKDMDSLLLPILPQIKPIIEKYTTNGVVKLPKYYAHHANNFIKDIAQMAGLTETVRTVKFIGSQRIEETLPKYKTVTWHTARRTFITLTIQKGVSINHVAKSVGHSDIKQTAKYDKTERDLIRDTIFYVWSVSNDNNQSGQPNPAPNSDTQP